MSKGSHARAKTAAERKAYEEGWDRIFGKKPTAGKKKKPAKKRGRK